MMRQNSWSVSRAGSFSGTLGGRSEEHTSELQSRFDLVCRLLLEKKKYIDNYRQHITKLHVRERHTSFPLHNYTSYTQPPSSFTHTTDLHSTPLEHLSTDRMSDL